MNSQRKHFASYIAVFFALIIGVLTLTPAQGQTYLYGRGNFAAGTQGTVIVADLNGDGHPDLAVSDENNNAIDILLGSSSGGFVAAGSYPTGKSPTSLVAADFNGDKKLDLAVVDSQAGTVSILLGNGDGTFQTSQDYPVGYNPTGLVTADFNGDGKLDLATLATGDSSVAILLGDGHGGFDVQALIPLASTPSNLVAGDVNGDGKTDLITCTGNYPSTIVSLVSKGDGSFTQVQSQAANYANAIALGDFNRDGKLDVLIFGNNNLYLSLGNGDGSFQNPVQIPNAPISYYNTVVLLVGDFNHDHKLDVALTGVWTMLGNGDGTFQNPIASPTTAVPMVLSDVNGDGQLDLVAFGSNNSNSPGSVAILLGNGSGSFMDISSVGLATSQNYLGAEIAADFNGDGKLDLAVLESAYPNPQVSVELGRGNGKFGQPLVSSFTSSANYYFGLAADFNGDKKADLIVLDNSNGFQVVLGNGDGTFGAPVDTPLTSAINSLAVGDFNHDGKDDVVATFGNNNSGPFVQIFLSNGDGTFTPGAQYINYPNSYVTVADVNGDGNLDLVLTSTNNNYTSYNLLVFLGNGDGTFRDPILGPAAPYNTQAAIGDFNRDGKLDLVVYTSGYQSQGFAFMAGNGDGTFGNPVYSDAGWSFSGTLIAADFDGDGKLDIAATPGGCCNSSVFLALGNGDGTFGSPLEYDGVGNLYQPRPFVVGDFNSDGVADIGLGGSPAQNTYVESLYLSTPVPGVFPSSLNFGKVPVGKTTRPKKVIFTNIGNSKMKISGIKVDGDFLEKSNCGKNLAVGKSCTVQVSFKPTAKGTRKGTVSISDNAPGSPQNISLSGIGQ